MKPCNNNQRLRRSLLGMLLTAMILAGTLPSIADVETATRVYDPAGLTQTRVTAPDGNDYMKVEWAGLDLTETAGKPRLPVEFIRFLVPVYTKVTGVSVKVGSETSSQLSVPVYPGQVPMMTNYTGPEVFTQPDTEAYSQSYPIRAEYVDEGFLDGCNHIVTVAVYPVSYDPKSQAISITTNIDVILEYKECSCAELTSTPLFPPTRSRYLNLDKIVVNPSKVSDIRFAPRREAGSSEQEFYYIITPDNLKDAFQDLAAWKQQKGYSVIIQSIEEICKDPRYSIGSIYISKDPDYPSGEVVDSAMSLKCYLKDQYDLHGAYFCLLAGDWHTSMPIRRVVESRTTNALPNTSDFSPTDNYFADFTAKPELTNKYGNIYSLTSHTPYDPEIYIGRLLCYKPEHIKNYVNKLMIYESDPGLGNADYLDNALYFYGNGGLEQQGKAEKNFKPFKNTLVVVDSCCVGGSSLPHTGSDLIKYMRGKGFISFNTHGSPVALRTCEINTGYKRVIPINSYRHNYELGPWIEDDGNDISRGIDCMNNAGYPGILYTIACDTAPFDDFLELGKPENAHYNMPYNMAQAYTIAGNYGGVAYLANTRSGHFYLSTDLQAVWGPQMLIHPKIGIGEAYSKSMYQKKNGSPYKTRHQLIGEPEFEMWFGKPEKLNVDLIPSSSGVDIKDGILPDSTYYAISDGNSYSTKSLVLGNVHFQNPCAGEYSFSLWRTGYLPVIKLYGQRGTLAESKRYIVQDAVLGLPNSSEGYKYQVVSGGKLSVYATRQISTHHGFEIQNGGIVDFDCEGTIELNDMTVCKGGTLIIKAKNVKMGSNFKVENGANFRVNN